MVEMDTNTAAKALQGLSHCLPEAHAALGLAPDPALKQWRSALDIKLLPRFDHRFPLIAAVCGGGSAGKSTLFNSLIGRHISPTGGRAGLNRRVLAALTEDQGREKGFLKTLAHGFHESLEPLNNARQLSTPGDPLYWSGPGALSNVILLDTPDIDTGARGEYHNREQAQLSMESADLFVYIFTNATYNNRDNTDFIAHMFTGMGLRPCFLVYRVYAAYHPDEVTDHALTVARNIYGDDYQRHVLGIFRADEDNEIAAGRSFLQVRTVMPGKPDLHAALTDLRPADLRKELMQSLSTEAMAQAQDIFASLHKEKAALERYIKTLEQVQGQSVQRALAHFPTERVMDRFARIWLATDPKHLKIMRRTGQVVEWPIKALTQVVSMVDRLRTPARSLSKPAGNDDSAADLAADLLNAATWLYQQATADPIASDDDQVAAPPVVHQVQQQLGQKNWEAALRHIQARKETILSWSMQLEDDLRQLADQLRSEMSLWDRMRQTSAAVLNVLPATAAVTYVLSTGDPVGATGIKIKLTGLLGLKDLYALIAIPATAGLKKADQKQLARLLAPVARTWLAHKFAQVQALFEEQITGDLFGEAREAQLKAWKALDQAGRILDQVNDLPRSGWLGFPAIGRKGKST